jgi:hypothetical protein
VRWTSVVALEILNQYQQSVHKVLEKEVKPEEIRVDVNTEEERWGLRCGSILQAYI